MESIDVGEYDIELSVTAEWVDDIGSSPPSIVYIETR